MSESAKAGWKDYLALLIALLRTVLLPLVILGAVLFIISILVTQLLK